MPPTIHVSNWVWKDTIFVLVVTGLTVLFGILLSEVQNKIGWAILITSLAFVIAIFATLTYLVMRPVNAMLDQALRELKHNISPDTLEWLLDTDEMVKYEIASTVTEIWLISSDFLDDSPGGPFMEVVTERLKQGTNYVYFAPDTPQTRARTTALRAQHQHSPNLHIVFLPNNLFLLVPKLDISIYNPLGKDSEKRMSFMGLPALGEDVHHYHVSMSTDFVDSVVGTLLPGYQKTFPNGLTTLPIKTDPVTAAATGS